MDDNEYDSHHFESFAIKDDEEIYNPIFDEFKPEKPIELDLEDEGTEASTKIVVLTDEQRKELLSEATTFQKFREVCQNLSNQELLNLADYAIENEMINMDKCRFIKAKTGRDIIKTIENNRGE